MGVIFYLLDLKGVNMSKAEQINKAWSQHYDRQKWIEGMGLQEYDIWYNILGAPPDDVMSIHIGDIKTYRSRDVLKDYAI